MTHEAKLTELKLRRFRRLRRHWQAARVIRWVGGGTAALAWGIFLALPAQEQFSAWGRVVLTLTLLTGLGTALSSFPYQWWLQREIAELLPSKYRSFWPEMTPVEINELFLEEMEITQGVDQVPEEQQTQNVWVEDDWTVREEPDTDDW